MVDNLTIFQATAKLAATIGHEARSLFLRLEEERALAVLATRFLNRVDSLISMLGDGVDAQIFSADLGDVYAMYAAAVCGPAWSRTGKPAFLNDQGAPYESHVTYLLPLGKALDGLAALSAVGSLAEAVPLLRGVITQLRDVVVITWGPVPILSSPVAHAWRLPPRENVREVPPREAR